MVTRAAVGILVVLAALFFAVPYFLGGSPVEPTGNHVTSDTKLKAGDPVVVLWEGAWWKASVMRVLDDGRVKVHYEDWVTNGTRLCLAIAFNCQPRSKANG